MFAFDLCVERGKVTKTKEKVHKFIIMETGQENAAKHTSSVRTSACSKRTSACSHRRHSLCLCSIIFHRRFPLTLHCLQEFDDYLIKLSAWSAFSVKLLGLQQDNAEGGTHHCRLFRVLKCLEPRFCGLVQFLCFREHLVAAVLHHAKKISLPELRQAGEIKEMHHDSLMFIKAEFGLGNWKWCFKRRWAGSSFKDEVV